MIYKFYKSSKGTWWIDLPLYPFNKDNLQMVAGADDLLDILSDGGGEVYLKLSTKPLWLYDEKLTKIEQKGFFNGAIYETEKTPLFNEYFEDYDRVWICPVTLWVFLRYPKEIYIKKVLTTNEFALGI